MSGETKKHLFMVFIALVAAALFFLLFTQNHPTPDSAVADHTGAPLMPSSTEDAISAWYGKINDAITSAEFDALAHELMAVAPAEAVNGLMESLLGRWIEKDLAAALDFAAKIEAEALRETLLRYALAAGGYLDFSGVMNWISRQPESLSAGLVDLLYTEVGKDNPEHALRFIDLLNDGKTKERILRTVLKQWALRDITVALSWMNTQALPPALDDMKASLLARLTEQNPQEAGVLIRNMQAGHGKNTAARNHAATLARTDIREAMNWAGSLDDPDAYGIALTAAYESWFQTEPDKKLIMEQVLAESDSGLRDRLINEIALDIANTNPAELAALVNRLPETSQPDVAEKAVRFWKERDSVQALNWVKGLAPGPVKDRASKVMVEDFLLKGDRQGALALVASIGDNRMRYESVRSVAEQWYQANPSEARQALDGISFLSEAEKASINSYMQQRQ